MDIKIGEYNAETRTVVVVFETHDVVHTRSVNACHTDDNVYDEEATAKRIEDVAIGVEKRIAMCVITNPPPPMEILVVGPVEALLTEPTEVPEA